MFRALGLTAVSTLLGIILVASTCPGPPAHFLVPGLTGTVRVSIDELGVPHVEAQNDHDAFLVQGFLHARDRFFQMDWNRRFADGRLAEFSGNFQDLIADASARVLGLRAAAQRSLDALPPDDLAVLQAYADGVNAWLALFPLPPEYAALEVSVVAPWTPLDTLLLARALFAVDLGGVRIWEIDETRLFESYVAALGEERARLLYPNELGRLAPWVPNATVPDALGTTVAARRPDAQQPSALGRSGELAQDVRSRADAGGFLARLLDRPDIASGSNAWGVAASHSETGGPLVAGDPHLGLAAPAFGYELHLVVQADPLSGPLNVSGASLPGAPGIVLGGQNADIAWATTVFGSDVSDVFRDRLIRGDPSCPARLCIRSAGALHAVEERSESYALNSRGDGVTDNTTDVTAFVTAIAPQAVQVLTVPFRSFGPALEVADRSVLTEGGPTETDILTLQWSGLHVDRAVRYVRATMRARDVFEFGNAVRWLTFGLNHVVADVDGNLAYYGAGEIPLRTDLEAGTPLDGMPPLLIRDGSGPANWIADPARSQGQILPFAVLPREELPQVVNPPAGFVVNCNEDPSGFVLDNDLLNQSRPSNPLAIHYLGDIGTRGLRNGRVTNLLREKIQAGQAISLDDMKRIQADTQALHVNVLLPHLLAAFEAAQRAGAPALLASLAADPRIVEATGRLAAWDFSHPTGIAEGYDASDIDGVRTTPVSDAEARASVAATIYEVWAIKLVKHLRATLEAQGLTTNAPIYTLVWLLSQDPFTGVGASGVNFFPEPAALADAADRRDAVLLGVLRDVLDALPGPAYALAFANSTDQDDYRWGRLHRMVAPHPLGGAASIPPAAGITDLAPQLPGFARDGTWDSVNVAPGPGLPDGANEWVSRGVAAAFFRHVHAPLARSDSGSGMLGFAVLAGGSSGDPQSPDYASQLGLWLTADYHAVPMTIPDVRAAAKRIELFDPPLP